MLPIFSDLLSLSQNKYDFHPYKFPKEGASVLTTAALFLPKINSLFSFSLVKNPSERADLKSLMVGFVCFTANSQCSALSC